MQLIELYVQLKEPILIRQLESCGDTNGKEIKCELMTEGNVIKVTSQVEGEDNALNYKKYSDSHVINFVSEEVKQITIDTKKPPEIAISPSLVISKSQTKIKFEFPDDFTNSLYLLSDLVNAINVNNYSVTPTKKEIIKFAYKTENGIFEVDNTLSVIPEDCSDVFNDIDTC